MNIIKKLLSLLAMGLSMILGMLGTALLAHEGEYDGYAELSNLAINDHLMSTKKTEMFLSATTTPKTPSSRDMASESS
jgi:hypothetical protein